MCKSGLSLYVTQKDKKYYINDGDGLIVNYPTAKDDWASCFTVS